MKISTNKIETVSGMLTTGPSRGMLCYQHHVWTTQMALTSTTQVRVTRSFNASFTSEITTGSSLNGNTSILLIHYTPWHGVRGLDTVPTEATANVLSSGKVFDSW